MSGERYSNGMLEGFLNGRGQLALGYLLKHIRGEAKISEDEFRAWEEVVLYASDALSEYQENGDSQKVMDLTGQMMDATDKALGLRRQ